MDAVKRLSKISLMIDIPPGYPKEKVNAYIEEVTQRMIDSGVSENIANSELSIGCIARGVDDLMRPDGELSKDFWGRVAQLSYKRKEESTQ